ncbi:glycosyltransferase family 39 protein [Mucilaginibacter sp. dw_454]|uniref:ArnT family glycosyltransferase n=1 Tax=Mucilaginibacter sp. dw_454 TaxID=2720079 RepID=UPI001BD338DB|nr:glycosyltransferase family 39 protein [Mucilaginibacter sp. dw_454]
MLSSTQTAKQSDQPIWWFLLCWTILNVVQASTLELHADEAYYWMYSRFLDWGYFDHPPMVALFIRIGDSISHTELGLRLLTVIASTTSIYILWLILKKYAVNIWAFILVVSGMLILHIYGFTTTPDAPLFFFSVLFYYFYQRYIDEDKWSLAAILGIVVACMFYSKYHAVLLVAFTVISNIKLLKRPSFWLIAGLAVVLYIPHILWQAAHGFPSVNYHLYEQAVKIYNPENTYLYIPGQLLMAGPLIGWFLFYSAFTIKIKDSFIRCLLVNGIGTFAFFFFSTFRGEAQPHWTLIAFAPLVMLSLIRFNQKGGVPKWFNIVAGINVVFVVGLRLGMLFQWHAVTQIGQIKSYYGFKDWAQTVHKKIGDSYLIMNNGFQNPSKYNYYTNSLKAFAYDSRYYRRTQYDIWPIEEQMQHQRAYYLVENPESAANAELRIPAGVWYGGWVDSVRTYQKLEIETPVTQLILHAGEQKAIDLTITNPYPYSVNFSNKGQQHQAALEVVFFENTNKSLAQKSGDDFNNISLKPGASTRYTFNITAPQKGKYDMVFSIRTEPFMGSKNSRIISLVVN